MIPKSGQYQVHLLNGFSLLHMWFLLPEHRPTLHPCHCAHWLHFRWAHLVSSKQYCWELIFALRHYMKSRSENANSRWRKKIELCKNAELSKNVWQKQEKEVCTVKWLKEGKNQHLALYFLYSWFFPYARSSEAYKWMLRNGINGQIN